MFLKSSWRTMAADRLLVCRFGLAVTCAQVTQPEGCRAPWPGRNKDFFRSNKTKPCRGRCNKQGTVRTTPTRAPTSPLVPMAAASRGSKLSCRRSTLANWACNNSMRAVAEAVHPTPPKQRNAEGGNGTRHGPPRLGGGYGAPARCQQLRSDCFAVAPATALSIGGQRVGTSSRSCWLWDLDLLNCRRPILRLLLIGLTSEHCDITACIKIKDDVLSLHSRLLQE